MKRETEAEPTSTSLALWKDRLVWWGRRVRKTIPFIAGIAAALTALWIFTVVNPDPVPLTARQVNETVAEAMASATPPPAVSAQVYQVIAPSLVYIQAQFKDASDVHDFAVGSGVVISDNAEILTSLHVVADASEIHLTFVDGSESGAELVGAQPENDIAVLRALNPPGLVVPAVLGNPAALRVGDEAFVVGNPLGLFGSMSAGVISGFDRSFLSPSSDRTLEGLIQIDAAVNPGNSGGPLLNRDGQVVGIIAALANPTRHDVFIGIGFAVPINVAASAANLPPY